MFRGFLQPSLDSQLPAAQAVAITAAAFAFFHTPWTVQPTIFVLGYEKGVFRVECETFQPFVHKGLLTF